MEKKQAVEEVLAAGKELVARGLVARTWGNISCRVDEKSFVITPSGSDYARLTPETIVQVDMESLAHTGGVKPASEKGIHAAAYRLNPDTHFVIHTHQAYASCVSVAGYQNLKITDEEKEALGGDVLRAPYGLPGTKSLRKKVEEKLTRGRVILMEKHGALITGDSRQTAFNRSVVLEEVCRRAIQGYRISEAPPDGASCPHDQGEILYRDKEGNRPLAAAQDRAGRIHASLRAARPEFKFILHRASPVIEAVMDQTDRLPALLDDFAQIVGGDIRRISGPEEAALKKATKGRYAVLVEGLGVFCLAGEESDAEAILTLVEKNALCYLNAAHYGKPKPLSWFDRKLMRLIYTKKYSKKK
ncbi:MAG: class II aldolase/adducin family protein [Clostridiaceae bacterium]|nr:class II aldolase/adducin family protein [Clostridiaceae bacterium]